MASFFQLRPRNAGACEIRRKLASVLAAIALIAWLGAPSVAAQEHGATEAPPHTAAGAAQPQSGDDTHAAPGAGAHGESAQGEAHGTEEHGESIWSQLGRITNFVLLVGLLVYFLRAPLARYITGRREQVRADLTAAEEMKKTAAAQIAEIDAKLKALPRELDEIRGRGQQEIEAEERRIRDLAESERARLLEQARRDIDQQVRLARRELVEHAASLAIGVAEQKVKAQITDDDQRRLVDRFVTQVDTHERA
jgi:F-type H+-transporting ATPase subunit b